MKKTMMKRFLVLILALALTLGGSTAAAFADSSNVRVNVGNKAVEFTGNLGAPYINNDGRTLVPFRAVANFMYGVEVSWDGEAREAMFAREEVPVVVDGESLKLTYVVRFPIDTNQIWESFLLYDTNHDLISSHDRLSFMDTNAVIKDSRTYAPIRFLAESFLYDVGWDDRTRTVLLTQPMELTWSKNILAHEASRGTVVKSQSEALLFAKEFARKGLNDNDTPIRFSKQTKNYLDGESGVTGWIFEFLDYDDGELYVNDLGETWVWSETQEKYILWA